MHKKLFVFDLDGTLLNSYRLINDSTVKTLTKAIDLGHDVVFATGRNFCQLSNEIKTIKNIKYTITINGGIINDLINNQNIILSSPLDQSVVKDFFELAKKLNRELQWSNDQQFYRVYFGQNPYEEVDDPNFFYKGNKLPAYDDFNVVGDSLFKMPIFHIAVKCEKKFIHAHINELKQKFEQTNICKITETSKCYLDGDPIGIDKYNAIKRVQALLGYDNSNTYCFGDSDNDYEMIKNVDHGIAMGNANDNIKSVAKYIIGDHDSDAISNFIENILEQDV